MKKKLLELRQRFRPFLPTPLGQAISVFCVATFLSLVGLYVVLIASRPRVIYMRSGVMLAYARVLQSHPEELIRDKSDILPRLADAFGTFSFSIWMVDGQGNVISRNVEEPLPVPWSEIPSSTEEYSVRWALDDNLFRPLDALAAVRLVSNQERHLVFHFSPRASTNRPSLILFLGVLHLINFGISIFVYFMARRNLRESAI